MRPEAPPLSPVAAYLSRLHARYATLADGEVATYIPELSKADPSWFGISLVTADGSVYEAGDTRHAFTIQSISKPLTYGLVLDEVGAELVRERIGVEPTGDAFNSISLAPATGTPLNPMINAGAIAAASLLTEQGSPRPIDRLLQTYSGYAGRPLTLDWAVFRSESATGHRNRAIAHLLRSSRAITGEAEPAVELYFQQCSVSVDCRDLGVIAATLANGGVNPLTGERVASSETVRSVLSVMTSCGMYDSAGEWLFSVGLPAKSGVSGGILAVLPGQLGVGVFSPPLDAQGNSVRGIRVCQEISSDLNLHLVQSGPRAAPPIRSAYTVAQVGSKRVRSELERAALTEVGQRAVVYELQGEISFSAAEAVARGLVDGAEPPELAVLDLGRARLVDPSVVPLFVDLVHSIGARDGRVGISGIRQHVEFVHLLEASLNGAATALTTFSELDLALEWCETVLLSGRGHEVDPPRIRLRDHELLHGLSIDEAVRLRRILRRRRIDEGSLVIRKGDPAAELYLLVRGNLSVTTDVPGGERKRLATLSAGMVFGELAILTREPRSADVRADTAVDCYVLPADELDRLGETDPALKSALLENLLRIVSRLARRMSDELVVLAG